jgi:hypothetical protein
MVSALLPQVSVAVFGTKMVTVDIDIITIHLKGRGGLTTSSLGYRSSGNDKSVANGIYYSLTKMVSGTVDQPKQVCWPRRDKPGMFLLLSILPGTPMSLILSISLWVER